MVSSIDDPQALIKMLDYAIQYFYTDKRDEALAILEKNEEQLNFRNRFRGSICVDFPLICPSMDCENYA